ncbi:cytochrome P450 [Penicillium malachiteum]|nr:cytochrome P450 [Penicillium malachiteum]
MVRRSRAPSYRKGSPPAMRIPPVPKYQSYRFVVKESLRLAYGVPFRSARVSQTEAMTYDNYVIPPGTRVSQSSYFVSMDPSIFSDPRTFNPDRWIEAAERGHPLFIMPDAYEIV